jgi:hypothetical protein
VALPKNHPYGNDLKKGDVICFSYQVVADRDFNDEPQNFHPYVNEENLQIFFNGKGEKIQVRAVQGIIAKKFVCCFFDKKGEFESGYEGTFHEKERWLAQFKYGNTQQYRFTNCIELDGELLWKCSFDQIFAKKIGKKLISIGNKLILNPIKVELTDEMFEKNGVAIPEMVQKITLAAAARVESAPAETGLKKGAKLAFDPRFIERYQFFGKEYILLEQNRIMGIWQN